MEGFVSHSPKLYSAADDDTVTVELDDPQTLLLHERFENRVTTNPNAIAVVSKNHALTYAELNLQADRLARALLKTGLQVGQCVPVVMHRSAELVIALIALLKCGAVYVPIDPNLPKDRRDFMVRDCSAQIVLTDPDNSSAIIPNIQTINVADLSSKVLQETHAEMKVALPATAAAYIMYTSGSTGTPKGVVIPHGAVVALAVETGFFQVQSDHCVPHCSNPAFDAATFEVWATLLNGAKLLIVSRETVLDPRLLDETFAQNQATLLFLTTALFNRHVLAGAQSPFRVRYCLFGGEAADPKIVNQMCQRGIEGTLFNVYGPTETTTFATSWRVKSLPSSAHNVPIGRPLPLAHVYILDANLRPVAAGQIGEIYIGGAGVAWGYLNRPDLTADSFRPDLFSYNAGARMYKSGDLGHWNDDGDLEYEGRIDFQVKIRGFRIELGELESVLRDCVGVHQAVAVVREDAPGEKSLVAYVVPTPTALEWDRESRKPTSSNSPSEPTFSTSLIATLKATIEQKLPAYMSPKAIVILDRFPITENGKIDRKSLPLPDRDSRLEKPLVPARTTTERTLSEIWKDVLGIKQVGVDDDFFRLGGDSIQAIALALAVSRKYDVQLSILSLHEHTTIASLARLVEIGLAEPRSNSVSSSLSRQSVIHSAPLSMQQDEFLAFSYQYPAWTFWVTSTLQIRGELDVSALRAASAQLARRHEALRTRILVVGGEEPTQVVDDPGDSPLKITTLEEYSSTDRERAASRHVRAFQTGFVELGAGPLFKVQLLKIEVNEHLLLVAIHHILADAVSFTVLMRQLWESYDEAKHHGERSHSIADSQYSHYAISQHQNLQEGIRETAGYWTTRLAGAKPLRMPPDLGLEDVRPFCPAPMEVRFDKILSTALQEVASAEGTTPALVLASLYAFAASTWCSQDDFLLWFHFTGRVDPAHAETIGLFVTSLPLRIELSAKSTFVDLLHQTRDEFRAACRHLHSGWFAHRRPDLTTGTAMQWVPWGSNELAGVPEDQEGLVINPFEPVDYATLEGWPPNFKADNEVFWHFTNADSGILGFGYYRADLFRAPTIQRFIDHLQWSGREAIAESNIPLQQLYRRPK